MKNLRTLLGISLFAFILFSCKKEAEIVDQDQTVVETGTDVQSNGISAEAAATPINETLLLQMVNDVRQRGCNCGTTYMPPVAPLTWNELLETSAYNHSNDMFTYNYFSHTGRDGANSGTRARRVGYNWRALGENIAKGYPNETAVINAWLKSPGHCKNIMNSWFKDMGISRVGSYWTQVLGQKK